MRFFRFSVAASTFALTAALVPLLLVAAPQVVHAQITVTNPGSSTIQNFGISNTASYGQVITAPGGNTTLSGFAFTFVNFTGGSTPIPFRAYVFGFNNATLQVTGPALFASATLDTPTVFPATVTVNTGSTAVTAGSQYLLLFSTSGLQAGQPSGGFSFFSSPTDRYAGGQFVYMNNGNDVNQLTTGTYSTLSNTPDLAFTATFNAVAAVGPEPGSLPLLGMGLTMGAGMVGGIRRRKAKQSA